jgi:hypothetical protein
LRRDAYKTQSFALRQPANGGDRRHGGGLLGQLLEPRLGSNCSAQTINKDVRINKVHRADLVHPSERSFRANSELSSMSVRSRHIPKNSEFSKSLKVEWGRDPEDETVITISADPVGTSAGSLMRSSRLAGISALRVTVFTIRPSPHLSPYQKQFAFTTTRSKQ